METKEDNSIYGFTENYIKVKIPGEMEFKNNIVNVKLKELNSDIEAIGEIIN